MTIIAAGSGATFSTTGVSSGAIAGATIGSGMGIAAKLLGSGLAKDVGTAFGTSLGAGAIIGQICSGQAAISGALAGSASGGVTSLVASSLISNGPLGWLTLGTSEGPVVSYDCWKPVIHDRSPEPSNGRLLRDVVGDYRVKAVIEDAKKCGAKHLKIINIWDEVFAIEFIMINNEFTLHAKME